MFNFVLKGFDSPEALALIESILPAAGPELAEADMDELFLSLREDSRVVEDMSNPDYVMLRWNAPRKKCWKCTIKHLGESAVFAAESKRYPQHFVYAIGALYHAYQECPDTGIATQLESCYNDALDNDSIDGLDAIIKKAYEAYRRDFIGL